MLVLDESHVMIPQLGAMYKGDRSRKENLVNLRLSPAVGPGQPAAEVRGMGGKGAPGGVRAPQHPGNMNSIIPETWLSKWSARPAWSIQRWKCARLHGPGR